MKYLTLVFLFISSLTHAQLVFIGIDKPSYKIDAYGLGYKTPGMVSQGNKYFYLSPNANLVETDGTEAGTMSISLCKPSKSIAYLCATKRFVYYGQNPFGKNREDIGRYEPPYIKDRLTNLYRADIGTITLDDEVSPILSKTNSEIILGSKKDKIFIRTSRIDNKFANPNLESVFEIDDNKPEKIFTVYENNYSLANGDVPTYRGGEISDLGNVIFINGLSKESGFIDATVRVRTGPVLPSDTFKSITFFELWDQRINLHEGFLRTDTAIYFRMDNVVNGEWKPALYQFDGKNLVGASPYLKVYEGDLRAEVHDGIIYVFCKGYIFEFNEATKNFKEIAIPNCIGSFKDIGNKNRILKCGNNLMCNIGGEYRIYNLVTGIGSNIETPILPKEPNRFNTVPTYAYATSKNFVYFNSVGGKEQLVSYSPSDKTKKVITFPDFENETFEYICSLTQSGDKFFIAAAYTGKKNRKTYRLFILSN